LGDNYSFGAADRLDSVVEVPVTNTGERAGSEVVQVYVAPADHVVPRPEKELAGFAKHPLPPGETGIARVQLKERYFARWDVETHAWAVATPS